MAHAAPARPERCWTTGAAGVAAEAEAAAGAGAGCGGDGGRRRLWWRSLPGGRCDHVARTSSRVMRPPAPVPVTSDSLIPFSASSRRTIGDSTQRPRAVPVARLLTGAGCGGAAGACSGAGAGCGCRRRWRRQPGSGAGAGAGSPARRRPPAGAGAGVAADGAPSPMTASFTPTSTVSPSGTRISVRTPAAGEGTSESTLSVETSKSGSSRSTASPTAFIQRVIVPSVTVSPSCGIITSANVQSPSGQREHGLAECLGQRRVRLDELGHLLGEGLPVDGEVARH